MGIYPKYKRKLRVAGRAQPLRRPDRAATMNAPKGQGRVRGSVVTVLVALAVACGEARSTSLVSSSSSSSSSSVSSPASVSVPVPVPSSSSTASLSNSAAPSAVATPPQVLIAAWLDEAEAKLEEWKDKPFASKGSSSACGCIRAGSTSATSTLAIGSSSSTLPTRWTRLRTIRFNAGRLSSLRRPIYSRATVSASRAASRTWPGTRGATTSLTSGSASTRASS
jgi:hypothetical protein